MQDKIYYLDYLIFIILQKICYYFFHFFINYFLTLFIIKEIKIKNNMNWGLGIGDWGLGIGDWAQSPIPNPQSPIPNPHICKNKKNNFMQKNNFLIL